jgi:hypothetical protein
VPALVPALVPVPVLALVLVPALVPVPVLALVLESVLESGERRLHGAEHVPVPL